LPQPVQQVANPFDSLSVDDAYEAVSIGGSVRQSDRQSVRQSVIHTVPVESDGCGNVLSCVQSLRLSPRYPES